ncbi:MAG TPA: hypothetical protein VJV05_03880 [Pyrinomonadaceae bacterium]|nr:hypothetical protein [Pyrinomonadaceae bacterium]
MKRTPEEKLLNPRPGSKIAAARDFGIDLTLLVANLRLTPDERVRNLQSVMRDLSKIKEAGRISKLRLNDRA